MTQYQYHIGDPVCWKPCADGSIPAWSYWDTPHSTQWATSMAYGSNIGDPEVKDVLLTDWFVYPEPFPCSFCGNLIGGTVVEIRGGVIVGARCYRPGEFDQNVHTYTLNVRGEAEARPEWEDHAMSQVTCDVGPLRTAA